MIIFGSLSTTFEARSIFRGSWGISNNWLEPKMKLSNQVKLVYFPDTRGMGEKDTRSKYQIKSLEKQTSLLTIDFTFEQKKKTLFFFSPESK